MDMDVLIVRASFCLRLAEFIFFISADSRYLLSAFFPYRSGGARQKVQLKVLF
jgi:hypothetical protein